MLSDDASKQPQFLSSLERIEPIRRWTTRIVPC
jgi:hypothetical protein